MGLSDNDDGGAGVCNNAVLSVTHLTLTMVSSQQKKGKMYRLIDESLNFALFPLLYLVGARRESRSHQASDHHK